jgi:hypothetical protein
MKEVDRRLRSPFGVYSADDAELALGRVFGAGVRPLHLEEAVWEAMLEGWRAQQVARYFKPKTIKATCRLPGRSGRSRGGGRGSGMPRTSTRTSPRCWARRAACGR